MGKNKHANTYAESPLGFFVSRLLHGITEIKKRYPETKLDSIEKQHARTQIKSLEAIIKKLNDIFPEFNNRETPSSINFLMMGKGLIGLRGHKENFNTRDYTLYLNIKKTLPEILKKTQSPDEVIDILEGKKEELCASALLIPGKGIDVIFENVKQVIRNHHALLSQPEQFTAVLKKGLMENSGQMDISISHPMMFELIELLIRLKNDTPNDLDELMPFFNPEALYKDFHSGAIGGLISSISGKGYVLENGAPLENGSPSKTYVYNLTTHYNSGEPDTDTIDVKSTFTYAYCSFLKRILIQAQEYCDVHPEDKTVQKQLENILGQIHVYFKNNQADPSVQEHLTSAKLLNELIIEQATSITDTVTVLVQACQKEFKPNEEENDPLKTIISLNAEIEQNESLLYNIRAQKEKLQNKATLYSETTLSNLLDDTLTDLPDRFAQNEINTKKPLRHFVLGSVDARGEIKLTGVQHHLQQLILEQFNTLQNNEEMLIKKIQGQAKEKQKLVRTWQTQTIFENAKKTEEGQKKLESFTKILEEVINSNRALTVNDNQVETLEKLLKEKSSLAEKLNQMELEVNSYVHHVKEEFSLSEELIQFDAGSQIQNKHHEEILLFTTHSNQLSEKLDSALHAQKQEIVNLEKNLEQARIEAQFAQSMKAADPEKMKEGLIQIKQKISNAEKKEEEIVLAQKNTVSELDRNKQILINLIEENREQQILSIIQPLFSKIKMHALMPDVPDEKVIATSLEVTQQFMKSLQQQLGQTELTDKEIIVMLTAVETLCAQESNTKKELIPFKEIANLPALQIISARKHMNGFDCLLSILGIYKMDIPGLPKEIAGWKKYRKQQDDWLKFKPSHDQYKIASQFLLTHIKKIKAAAEIRKDLSETTEKLENCFSKTLNTTLILRLSNENQIYIKATEEIAELKKTLTQQSEDLELLKEEKESLKNDSVILEKIITIITGIKDYQNEIDRLSSGELTFSSADLYSKISELQTSHTKLADEITKLGQVKIPNLIKSQDHERKIKILSELLDSVDKSFAKAITTKVDVTPLEKQFDSCTLEVAKINALHAESTDNVTVNSLSPLRLRFNGVLDLIKQQNELIKQFQSASSDTNNNYIKKQVSKVILAQEKLHNESKILSERLIEDLIQVLCGLKEDARVFKDVGLQESTIQQKQFASKLESTKVSLDTLLDETMLKAIGSQFPHDNLKTVTELGEQIQHQYELSQEAHSQLSKRIEERATIVDMILIPAINSYIDQRNNKTTDNSAKKRAQELFFESLKVKLTEYKDSGDSSNVLSFIDKNQAEFPGLHPQAVLSKITAELLELNEKIPEKYNGEKSVPEEHVRLPKDIISTHPNPDYANAIDHLYTLIDQMSSKWPDTVQLTTKLRQDVDHFVTKHPKVEPNKENYLKFQKQFTARLHSEDNVLGAHRTAWKNNLANFAIGFITLGIALGIKLVASRLNQGQFSLFFDKTARQEQISSMEKIVKKNMVPPAV